MRKVSITNTFFFLTSQTNLGSKAISAKQTTAFYVKMPHYQNPLWGGGGCQGFPACNTSQRVNFITLTPIQIINWNNQANDIYHLEKWFKLKYTIIN